MENWKIARLQDCKIATVEQPRDLSGHDYFQKAVFEHPWFTCLDPNMYAGSNFLGANPQFLKVNCQGKNVTETKM